MRAARAVRAVRAVPAVPAMRACGACRAVRVVRAMRPLFLSNLFSNKEASHGYLVAVMAMTAHLTGAMLYNVVMMHCGGLRH